MKAILAFIIDYCQRHRHPVNALLHIVGVPAVFFGLYQLFRGQVYTALALIAGGYVLQYFGHQAQGNEVGEVTLLKNICKRINKSSTGKVST
jgi:hypothetical protein